MLNSHPSRYVCPHLALWITGTFTSLHSVSDLVKEISDRTFVCYQNGQSITGTLSCDYACLHRIAPALWRHDETRHLTIS